MSDRIAVFVPRRTSRLADRIARGSGIVGTPLFEPSEVVIDYEGNLHGVSNIRRYADRVYHAADRHLSRYPTIAREVAQREDLIEVGEFDGDAVNVYPDAMIHLAWWLGTAWPEGSDSWPLFDPHELHRS